MLHKQRREFEAIAALDFFPNAARSAREKALADADAAVQKLMFPAQSQTALAPDERCSAAPGSRASRCGPTASPAPG